MPRIITIFHKCTIHAIPGELIKMLHFNDLYLLLLRLDISNYKSALKDRQRAKMGDVQDISGADAVKFLKGG